MDCGCGGSGGDEGPLGELNPDTLAPGWAPDLGAGCGCGGGSACGCRSACKVPSQGDRVSGGRAAIGGGTLAKDCVPQAVCSEQQPTEVR
jgi:hypothetical protein